MKSYDISVRGFRQERPVVVEDFRREYTITIGNSRQECDLFVDDLPNDFGLMIRNKLVLSSNSFQPAHHRVLSNTQLENELALYTGDIRANKSIQVGIQDGLELKHSIYIGGDYTISLPENRLALSSLLSVGRDRVAIPSKNTLLLTVSVSPKKSQNISVEENILKLRSDIYLSGQMRFQLEPNILSLTSSLEVLYEGSGSGSVNLYTWEKWSGEPDTVVMGVEQKLRLAYWETSGLNNYNSSPSYANSVTIADGEIILVNPTNAGSIGYSEAGAEKAKVLIGKYIDNNGKKYYVSPDANSTYGVSSPYYANQKWVELDKVYLLSTSSIVELVTSENPNTYPDNGMQDGYWYVKCGDS